MAKFVIECPSCGSYAEASNGILGGLFATRKINCSCGHVIDVKAEKMSSRDCPHCGNMVIFDRSKGEKALCPVCHEAINTSAMNHNLAEFSCPSCNCHLSADKNATRYTCPLCDTVIDVQKQITKEKASNEGIASVIRYEGDADTLVWKHPIEDFNMGSQLIVHESQEAIFFRDGQALDLFGSGRYTLETHQLPIMERIYQLPSGTDKTFHSEVYYINRAMQMALKWGTPEKITLIDPLTDAPIAIGARGMLNFRVSDSRKILLKLVGTTSSLGREDILGNGNNHAKDYFRSVIQTGVATHLATIIRRENIDIIQIDQERLNLSEALKAELTPYFEDYGIAITEFLVEGIMLPQSGDLGYDAIKTIIKMRQRKLTEAAIENDTQIKFAEMEAKKAVDIRQESNQAQIEAAHRQAVEARGETDILRAQLEGQRELAKTQAEVSAERMRMQLEMERKAQAAQIEAEEMRAKGYSQKDVLQAEVMRSFAENQPEGGGMNMSGMAGQALQMGTGFAAMGAMAGIATNMIGTGAQIGREMTGGMMDATNTMMPGSRVNPQNQIAPGNFNLGNMNSNNAAGGNQSDVNANTWTCAACGRVAITSRFCPDCGAPRPEPVNNGWTCAACGKTGITSRFCPDCGAPRPEEPQGWNCSCGATNIMSNFCPECGNRRG